MILKKTVINRHMYLKFNKKAKVQVIFPIMKKES